MAVQNDNVTELFVLRLGDGASSETFAPLCSFAADARTFEINNEFSSRPLADCSTPTNPMITKHAPKSQAWSYQIEGTCNAGDDKTLADWAKAASAKNVQIENVKSGALKVVGAARVSSFQVLGPGKGESVRVSLSLLGDGAMTITASAG